MPIDRRRRLLLALPLLAGCAGLPLNAARNPRMDKTGWKTHCFGRHLIDLPPDAKVSVIYKIWGNKIERLPLYTTEDTKAKVQARERELSGQKHKSGSSLLVRSAALANGSVTLVYWGESFSSVAYDSESWLVVPHPYRVYSYGGDISPERLERALAFRNSLAQSLRPRKDPEIPTEPGFCIDGGYIAGSEYMDQSFSASIFLPAHPGAYLGFSGYVTGKPEAPLLERTGGVVAGLLGRAAGLSVLRRGQRNLGPIEAQEELIAGTDKGQRLYAFKWEAPGKAKDLAHPNLNFELGVLEQTPPPPAPVFRDDAQALALWDAMVDSIRLRPGAV